MAKQKSESANGPATTATSRTEVGVRDIIRTMKKNKKGISALQGLPNAAKNPALISAIDALKAEQAKLKDVALKIVAQQIEDALNGGDE